MVVLLSRSDTDGFSEIVEYVENNAALINLLKDLSGSTLYISDSDEIEKAIWGEETYKIKVML